MGLIKRYLEQMYEEEDRAEDGTLPDDTNDSKRRIEIGLKDGEVRIFSPDPAAKLPDADFCSHSLQIDEAGTVTVFKQWYIYEPEYKGWDVRPKGVAAEFKAGTYQYVFRHV